MLEGTRCSQVQKGSHSSEWQVGSAHRRALCRDAAPSSQVGRPPVGRLATIHHQPSPPEVVVVGSSVVGGDSVVVGVGAVVVVVGAMVVVVVAVPTAISLGMAG